MAGVDVVTAVFARTITAIAFGLDDQILGRRAWPAAASAVVSSGVSDGDQVSHKFPRSHASSFFPCAVKGMGHGCESCCWRAGDASPFGG
jgi:hypothetical protein